MYTDNIEYNFYILFFFLKYFKLVRYFLQKKKLDPNLYILLDNYRS
jgi:hypothetical protein